MLDHPAEAGGCFYFAGKVLRQEGEYDQAIRFFSLAIENYFRRAEQKVKELKNGTPAERERLNQELALSTLKSGIALGLGIGWVNYARGRLRQAMYENINPRPRSALARRRRIKRGLRGPHPRSRHAGAAHHQQGEA